MSGSGRCALGVERPLNFLWTVVFVPEEEAGLEQYLQVRWMGRGGEVILYRVGWCLTLGKWLCHILVVCSWVGNLCALVSSL